MALDRQDIPITFTGGLDTKTDPKQVMPGKFVALENGVFVSAKQISKRYGYAGLARDVESGGPAITNGSALLNFKNELGLFNGTKLYSYSPATMRYTDKGTATSIDLSVKSVIRNSYQQTTADSAYHPSGLKVFTWEDSRGGSRYSIIDLTTGQSIVSDGLIDANAVTPKPISIGQYVLIFFVDSTNQHLRYRVFTATLPGVLAAPADLATNLNATNYNFDVAAIGAKIFVTWNTNGSSISIVFINAFLTQSATLSLVGQAATNALSIYGDSVLQQVWIAWNDNTNTKYAVRDYNLSITPVLAPTVIEAISGVRNVTGYASNGAGVIFYEKSAAATYNYLVRKNSATNAGVIGSPGLLLRGVGLAGKPFTYGSATYLFVAAESNLQPTYFLVDTFGKVFGKFAASLGGGLTKKSILPEAVTLSSNQFQISYLQKDFLTTVTGVILTQTGVQVANFTFDNQNTYLKAELGKNQHINGAMVSMYDGTSVVEHGFHLYPENLTVGTSGTGGLILAGTYQYAATYEWTDNQGQLHRSAPSVAISQVTTGTTSTNTIVVPTLRITSKVAPRAPVSIVLYRTQSNLTVFYRVSSVTIPTFNDVTVDTVTFTDTTADSSLLGNALLYTTGGVLQNDPPPPSALITTYKNRIALVPSEDRISYLISKGIGTDTPVEFTQFFNKRISQRGGDINAIAEMDDKLVFFKESHIFYTYGQGPTATGTNDDIPDAIEVPTGNGAISPHVVSTPIGIMYKTRKGIFLLERSLQSTYIGAEVERYNGDSITSAVLVEDSNQVRFTLSSGVAIVYDYFFNQWYTFTNHQAIDATIFQGRYTWLSSNGIAMKEDPTLFTDNGAFVKRKMVTGWFSFGGLQGFQRVYQLNILGEYRSPHQLRVQIAYDFNPNPTQDSYIDATSLDGFPAFGMDGTFGTGSPFGGGNLPPPYLPYQYEVDFIRQKCTSFQVTVEDLQPSNYGESSVLSGFAFTIGIKPGANRLPASRSVG